MTRFFRQIRQRLLANNKFSKYLLYAVGEIILVVIGILIAIQLNSKEIERENNRQLTNIYKSIKEDLQFDTLRISNIIRFYESKDSILSEVLSDTFLLKRFDTINEENYEDCRFCRSSVTNFAIFSVSKNGYLRLNEFSVKSTEELDSLSLQLIQWYRETIPDVEGRGQAVRNLARGNHDFLEQFPWYLDYIERRYNEESVNFFTKDPMYRNKVATYKTMATNNYLRRLYYHKDEIFEALNLVDQRLGIE